MKDYRLRRKASGGLPLRETSFNPVRVLPSKSVCASDLVTWIERTLIVPTGMLEGKPFVVADFQIEWLRGAMEPGIQEAGMSIARKNGKSGFVAALLLCGLVGIWNKSQWRAVVASLTGKLAKELMDAVELTALASGLSRQLKIVKSPPPGIIYGANKSRIDFLAADKATGHAIGADLAIVDEAGLLQENKRGLWNALFSSISGRNGKFWCISIQGDGPLFAEMRDRQHSDRVYFREWVGNVDCTLNDKQAWNDANPGLKAGIKSMDYMYGACERAEQLQANEMHFRAYDLNQPVNPEREVIVSLNDYKKCVSAIPAKPKGECIVGIDLGGSASMTAAAIYYPDTGRIDVRGAFGDEPPISQRARADRMGSQYDVMIRQGELFLYPGKVTPVVPFLIDLFNQVTEHSIIIALGADRYRKAEAEKAFQEAGLPYVPVHWRGQGAGKVADGSSDVRNFQKAVLDQKLKPGNSAMLASAIANSVIRYDSSGNPALDKATKESRIDALSASVIAVGIGTMIEPAPLFSHKIHVV